MVAPITNAKTRRLARKQTKASSGKGSNPRRMVNLGTLFPDKVLTRMRYADVINRAPALAVTDERQFNLNSTFDPDLSGGGHQPMGRDQLLGTLYNKYRVHSVHYTIVFGCTNPGFTSSLVYAVPSNDTTAANSTISIAMEQPFVWYALSQFGAPLPRCSKKVNIWDILGRSRAEYLADDITGSNYNSNPTEAAVLKIGSSSADGTAVVVYSYTILMDMLVECYDRFTQSQS
jgi:hypothetical protein